MHAAPFHGGLGVIIRETGAEKLVAARRRPQLGLELPDVGQVDVLLVHDQTVQLDHRDLGRHGVEPVAYQRVFQKLPQEGLVLRSQLANGRIIGQPGLFLFETADELVSRLPRLAQGRFAR